MIDQMECRCHIIVQHTPDLIFFVLSIFVYEAIFSLEFSFVYKIFNSIYPDYMKRKTLYWIQVKYLNESYFHTQNSFGFIFNCTEKYNRWNCTHHITWNFSYNFTLIMICELYTLVFTINVNNYSSSLIHFIHIWNSIPNHQYKTLVYQCKCRISFKSIANIKKIRATFVCVFSAALHISCYLNWTVNHFEKNYCWSIWK